VADAREDADDLVARSEPALDRDAEVGAEREAEGVADGVDRPVEVLDDARDDDDPDEQLEEAEDARGAAPAVDDEDGPERPQGDVRDAPDDDRGAGEEDFEGQRITPTRSSRAACSRCRTRRG
jgi:hypothetical protein